MREPAKLPNDLAVTDVIVQIIAIAQIREKRHRFRLVDKIFGVFERKIKENALIDGKADIRPGVTDGLHSKVETVERHLSV